MIPQKQDFIVFTSKFPAPFFNVVVPWKVLVNSHSKKPDTFLMFQWPIITSDLQAFILDHSKRSEVHKICLKVVKVHSPHANWQCPAHIYLPCCITHHNPSRPLWPSEVYIVVINKKRQGHLWTPEKKQGPGCCPVALPLQHSTKQIGMWPLYFLVWLLVIYLWCKSRSVYVLAPYSICIEFI